MDEMRATAQYISRPGFGILVSHKDRTAHQASVTQERSFVTPALHARCCLVACFLNSAARLTECCPESAAPGPRCRELFDVSAGVG